MAQKLAGGDDYIRTKANKVVGLALNLKLNPSAPKIIVVGKGPRIEKRAALFLNQGSPVAVYIKINTNPWEYKGEFRATKYLIDSETIEKYRESRPKDKVAGILFLEPS